jgi:60Kd inner membrane protein
MLQQPTPTNPTEQELQTQQMQRTMVYLSPLMIGYFALQVPAGLGLYWFIGNCVSIIQQSFVVGWGNLLPNGLPWGGGKGNAPPPAIQSRRVDGPKSGPNGSAKELPKRATNNPAANNSSKARKARRKAS